MSSEIFDIVEIEETDLESLDCDSIKSIAAVCNRINEERGHQDDWECTSLQIMSKLFLIHSEISEAGEELRDDRMEIWYKENGKPEGFGVELADALVRLVTLAKLTNTDLEKCLFEKIKYNAGREKHHGRVMKV